MENLNPVAMENLNPV